MNYKHYSASLLSMFVSVTSYALPFNITPQGTLPTSIAPGASINVSYTVANNTLSARANNFVKWFPANVTQVLEPTDPLVCPKFFSLGPKGSINQSCTLKLKISGVVNRNDPDPHHHLYVCFPGGKTCAGPTPANSLNVSAAPAVPTTVSTAVGGFLTATDTGALTYFSHDNGATWSASLPPLGSYSSIILLAVGCEGPLCSAVGGDTDALGNELPLSYFSADGGVTWSMPQPFSLTGIPNGSSMEVTITSVSCSEGHCSAVGSRPVSTLSSSPRPLTYSSSDNGMTWSQPYLPSTTGLPSGYQSAFLGSVSCVGAVCNAVGVYDDASSNYQPLIYRSTDYGMTWPTFTIPSTAGRPPGYDSAELMSISCSGANCTAVGRMRSNPLPSLPFTYTSSDGGLTWSTLRLLSIAALPPGNEGVTLNGVSCSGTHCVAVGFYRDASSTHAVYYTSANNGVSWSGALLPTTAGIPAGFTDTELQSVSCIDSVCTAVGRYITASGSFPLTYHSTNNGATWAVFLPSIGSVPGAIGGILVGVGGVGSGALRP